MKILFIAKHDNGLSDDEGAVTFALESLGHSVIRLNEHYSRRAHKIQADFLLFFKWHDPEYLPAINTPKVSWYFDLVDFPDPVLEPRNNCRKQWMRDILPRVDLLFCTDGDWVNSCQFKSCDIGYYSHGKLIHLMQGADSRVTGLGESEYKCPVCSHDMAGVDILFTGIDKGGTNRQSFVEEMKHRYGGKFHHVKSGCYGRKLANLISSSKIVVAPDAPVTNNYWSNRVYNSLGFGAFLLHPYCEGLSKHYQDGQEIIFYHDRHDLFDKIDYYLDDKREEERKRVGLAGLEWTLQKHTYLERCKVLIQTVKERLNIEQ